MPIDMGKLEILNQRVHNLASAPSTPVEGQIYYNSTGGDKTCYFWDGTAWQAMKSGGVTYATVTELANVDNAAEAAGASATVARGDHKHAVNSAAPVAIGTANAAGTATTLALSDHVHIDRSHDHSAATEGTALVPGTLTLPLSATPAQTANGSTVWDSDGFFITVGDGTGRRTFYPVIDATSDPLAVGTAADGTEASVARKDHVHGHEAAHVGHDTIWAAKGDLVSASANDTAIVTTVGADDTILMADTAAGGGIKWVASGTPSTQAFGDAAAVGTGDTFTRGDHKHAMPAHGATQHQELIATADLTDWPRVAALDLGSQKITGLGTPTLDTDASTKLYVDQTAQGLDAKASVRAATTANGTLASAFANASVIDGITLATNDRILIKNQTASQENGIYVVQAAGAPVRATDSDAWDELRSAFAWVELGTVNADTGWVSTVDAGGTLNTTAVTFVQFASAGTAIAGAGLTKTGNVIDVIAGAGIEVAADAVAVERDNVNGRVPLLYAVSYGDAAATSFTITHNLGTLDVIVQVYTVADGTRVEPDITHSTTNTVTLAHAVIPTASQYRVVIHG